jgi:hypothetical protein
MPQDGSNGFVAPSATQRAAFKAVVTSMLQGQCEFALPASISANMRLRSFTDAQNHRNYCVLMEVASTVRHGYVDKGWGTFIVYPQATRSLSHHAPHPKFNIGVAGAAGDAYTERAAIRIFKQTDSRSFLMAGSRRSANKPASTCQSGYAQSDCAHNTGTMYYPANRALAAHYGASDWTAIEWHGKAASTCANDIYMSMGLDAVPPASSKLMQLKAAIEAQKPEWSVETPGAGSCPLNATDNTAGRLLNGVAARRVCRTSATSASGKFIHIEQTATLIRASLDASATAWANAINAAFP